MILSMSVEFVKKTYAPNAKIGHSSQHKKNVPMPLSHEQCNRILPTLV